MSVLKSFLLVASYQMHISCMKLYPCIIPLMVHVLCHAEIVQGDYSLSMVTCKLNIRALMTYGIHCMLCQRAQF